MARARITADDTTWRKLAPNEGLMATSLPETTRAITSTVNADGTVTLALTDQPLNAPGESEVVVRMGAAPINPSDLGLMFGGADMSTVAALGGDAIGVRASLSPGAVKGTAGRVGQAIPVGNEGSGTVVAAGASAEAQGLLGKTVSMRGGAMYAQYRCIDASLCLAMPEGTTAEDCASSFVNPLTVLGMIETMRMEGHSAIVHTAAASNLGQMLQKVCTAEGISLVNIVRQDAQAELLRGIGATHVCNSASDTFAEELAEAIAQTGATVGYDATGGGKLANAILEAMESGLSRNAASYSRYGSTVHKQVYLYGSLELGPTLLNRTYGMAWGVGGWLLPNFLARVGPDVAERLKQRVADEITTTFASRYTAVISLNEALAPDTVAAYVRKATGQKYLIDPWA